MITPSNLNESESIISANSEIFGLIGQEQNDSSKRQTLLSSTINSIAYKNNMVYNQGIRSQKDFLFPKDSDKVQDLEVRLKLILDF